jgi:two-component system sensor histidine kinase KdpD
VVQSALSPELPLVEFDAVLIERVLVNLLETCRTSPSKPEFTCLHPPPS